MRIERIRLGGVRLSMMCAAIVAAMTALPSKSVLAQAASASDTAYDFNIPAGKLATVLDAFSEQTGVQIGYPSELVAGKQAKTLSGQLGWREALGRLLKESGLEYRQVGDRSIVIQRSPATSRTANSSPMPSQQALPSRETEVKELEGMTVTGTRIRGGSKPSPVITIGSERIREEGFTDLGDAIRSVPQNFSGGQNPGVLSLNLAGAGLQNQNVTGGSTLNLRGLGPDATLTLLNGRRMSYGGFVQAVDISAIPIDAVERIEIVTDGASAVYGSDAVGGVGNVILKRDFDGVTVGTRYGGSTDGGLATREYTVTAGTTWSNGGLIATYKNASSDPIYARQRSYTDHLVDPMTIYPETDLSSGLISAYQSIGDDVEVRLDAIRSKREQHYNYVVGGSINRAAGETTTTFLSPAIEFTLPGDWKLTVAATWGKDEHLQVQHRESVATGESSLQINDCYCNESRVYEMGAEGPLFSLGSGEARIAIGAGYRTNDFVQRNLLSNAVSAGGDDSSRFAYAELNMPLVTPDARNGAGQRLELAAAVRTEDYRSFGGVTTPKLGLIYAPGKDFTLKTSWGKSFKTPTLNERYGVQYLDLDHPSYYGGVDYPADATALALAGGNPSLGPERARTWTASVAFHPAAIPGLDLDLSWFDIEYTDRVVQPIAAWWEAMTNPAYAQFLDYAPMPEEQAEVIAATDVFTNYSGAPYDPASVVAILNFQYVNASRQRIKGIDLSGSYRFDVANGELTVRGSASWLDSTQRISISQGAFDLAGTLHNPAKLNSRLGAVWNKSGFSASAFANYTGGVTNTSDGVKSSSFTTFDTTLRYSTAERGGAWSSLDFALTVQNLLGRYPPLYTLPTTSATYVPPYDSTNYSAIGRFVSFSVSKRW